MVKHLAAQTGAFLQSSGGQQGMSAEPAIGISTDIAEAAAAAVMGATATDKAIRAARSARKEAMRTLLAL
jgi:hypothetical protein